jgi:hypothetical protein
MGDRLVEDRHLHRQLAAGVEHEAAAVEHLVVLPAHHVEVDQRQAGLDTRATMWFMRVSNLPR